MQCGVSEGAGARRTRSRLRVRGIGRALALPGARTSEISVPTHVWPSSVMCSPERPEPQPTSSRNFLLPSLGSASSSMARAVSLAWISTLRDASVYLAAASLLYTTVAGP